MTGNFILSLDCEGRWGVADHLTAENRACLSDAPLRRAYGDIVAALDKHEIRATFAFVGAFTWSRETADLPALRELARRIPDYMAPILADIETGEGWFGEWALDLLPDVHEIGLHGTIHLPWSNVDEATAQAELDLLGTMPRVANAKTYVFPRNQVNHTHLLASAGIRAWRAARQQSRTSSFLSELNPLTAADPLTAGIPAGRFINWRKGARRLIPVGLTVRRARHMLRHAARIGGTVHFWSHPENIASAPGTLEVLDAILGEVAEFRKKGLIRTLTQEEFILKQPHDIG